VIANEASEEFAMRKKQEGVVEEQSGDDSEVAE